MSEELSLNSMNKKKGLGLLGGTFDPIHVAHIHIALLAYREFDLDQVVMIPSGQPPHKKDKENMTNKEDRFEMLRLVCKDHPELLPDRHEIDKEGLSYTYESLIHYKKKFADHKLYFIMGEDSLFDIEKWKSPERIMASATLLVARRFERYYDKDIEDQRQYLIRKYSADIKLISNKAEYISSTMLRERLAAGQDCTDLIPDSVIAYIKEKGLYQEKNGK